VFWRPSSCVTSDQHCHDLKLYAHGRYVVAAEDSAAMETPAGSETHSDGHSSVSVELAVTAALHKITHKMD